MGIVKSLKTTQSLTTGWENRSIETSKK